MSTPEGTPVPALLTTDLVALDAGLGPDRAAVVRVLAGLVAAAGRATGAEALYADAMAREAKAATGLPGGIAIPHCRSAAVTRPTLAFARLSPAVDFGAADGPADLVFLIAAPEHGDADHLTLLSALARALVRPEFVASLRAAGTAAEVVALVRDVVSPAPAAVPPVPGPVPATPRPVRRLVAVTACPTGIAHTYLAADRLAAAAREAGVELHVETQGASGSTPLDPAVVAAADAVVLAVDVGVQDGERFAGKPVVQSSTGQAISAPGRLIADALAAADDPQAPRVPATSGGSSALPGAGTTRRAGSEVNRWLLTGVSYMIPFVAAGGLLIALGFLLAGYPVSTTAPGTTVSFAQSWVLDHSLLDLPTSDVAGLRGGLAGYTGALLFLLGSLAFGFLVPALAGYTAYAIADRPGLAPGFTVGVVATTVGAGFLGGLAGGLIAGLVARWLGGLRVPDFVRGLMPVVIVPVGATVVAGGLMALALGRPLAAASSWLNEGLDGLSGGSWLALGVLLGAMMAFDVGGPVNKAAYAFATTGLSSWFSDPTDNTGPLVVMATVMTAGMIPPLALALASTVLRPRLFTPAERDSGRAAWLLGLAFISEGAVPFAATDRRRVIPAVVLGSATAGAIVAGSGVELSAPHGGVFVFFAVTGWVAWAIGLVAGTVVGGVAVVVAKSVKQTPAEADAPSTADRAHGAVPGGAPAH